MQRAPVDGDLAGADAEKTAKIDNSGSDLASAINDNVDDPPHVVAGRAKRLDAENALKLLTANDGGRNGCLLFLGRIVTLRRRRGGRWRWGRRGGVWLRRGLGGAWLRRGWGGGWLRRGRRLRRSPRQLCG